ncbi:OLC1v1032196C1 [Oldenlandia corymbosa var. corymbosa]|uniref:OLC1v1032196C1 n=1 Tax=Oldenlandia corymbosa var. corymbosa TaxID=529605 RepID=A0AAV1CNL5_OLDCO|nr:OLC1v1032196C1 [Oldenlandia corymbosa var. corymbosa]
MEGEIAKLGLRGKRIPTGKSSYDNSLRSSLLSSQLGSDGGLNTLRPSELQMMMMTSRSDHSNFLKDLHHRQDVMDRQHAVLTFLEKAAEEAQSLREENIGLKMVNSRLTGELAYLREAASHYAAAAVGHSGMGVGPDPLYDLNSIINVMESMGLVGESNGGAQHDCKSDLVNTVPPGFKDFDPTEEKENLVPNPDRVTLPKSISIRSNGYLKTAQPGGSSGLKANKQRVYVPGGETEEEPLEVDVYKQGMRKTELCNKWQETGTCPYGENCQFAHGIKELRPIIRHPRYKTEVCRMVLDGVHCPYGHRCHFRHTLTDEEKLKRSRNVRPLKPVNR